MKKGLAYVSNYLKSLIIPHTPDNFTVAEPFRHGLTDDEMRKGMAAFRDFLYALFERLAVGENKIDVKTGSRYDLYGSLGANGNGSYGRCFPSIFDLTIILFYLGTHGRLETESKLRLAVRGEDLFTVICPVTEKYHSFIRMSGDRKLEMFRLLSDLGLHFNGADFSEEVDLSKTGTFYVQSEKNNFFAIGLKLIAEATTNHKDYIKIENLFYSIFMRCDFKPLANTIPKRCTLNIREFINAQRSDIREWLLDLDTFLIKNGCKMIHGVGGGPFTYTKRNTSITYGMVCIIEMRITGCFIIPGVNHLSNPNNIISILPNDMVDLIKSGEDCTRFDAGQCYRRSGNMPFARFSFTHNCVEFEGCRHAGLRCQFAGTKCRFTGYTFDLDTAETRDLMRRWVEMELAI